METAPSREEMSELNSQIAQKLATLENNVDSLSKAADKQLKYVDELKIMKEKMGQLKLNLDDLQKSFTKHNIDLTSIQPTDISDLIALKQHVADIPSIHAERMALVDDKTPCEENNQIVPCNSEKEVIPCDAKTDIPQSAAEADVSSDTSKYVVPSNVNNVDIPNGANKEIPCDENKTYSSDGINKIVAYLSSLSIPFDLIEHEEVFTVETMMEVLSDRIPAKGAVTKNLFLKDRKKKLYLFTALHDREVNLSDLAKKIGVTGGLRFADEAVMIERLGVAQGCCTPLALMNDGGVGVSPVVKFVADAALFDEAQYERIYSHPLDNSATLGVSIADFGKFVKSTGHDIIKV